MRNAILISILFLISNLLFGQNKDCGCFDGIGSTENDKPSLTVEFSDGDKISVCGYEEKKISDNKVLISEFDVFNCKTGLSLTQYDAVQNCQVSIENGILVIIELKYLPAGDNWKWIQVPIGIEKVLKNGIKVLATGQTPSFEEFKIEKEIIEKFYSELDSIEVNGEINDPENVIGKLEILALNGEQKARTILFDFENYFNYETDGAIAEQWKDAVAIVKWIKN
ncbi:hypothetical protein [Draconibacterium orientale]|uniref:hypothetical protein n=1 Tax=Draconibacterium orientale TaxID=1168034 RepID=UPI002ABD15FF|nr:hypothetical protein [Draconibacterium orientale]